MFHAQLGAYQTIQTTTADPARRALLLFDGAIRFVRQASHALEHGDVAGFAHAESRAHAIIAELRQALDHEVGGELAANLDRLYDFMLRHLTQGLIKRDPNHLVEVSGLLQTIRTGFDEVIEASTRERR
jgi:flagellar protein FliS